MVEWFNPPAPHLFSCLLFFFLSFWIVSALMWHYSTVQALQVQPLVQYTFFFFFNKFKSCLDANSVLFFFFSRKLWQHWNYKTVYLSRALKLKLLLPKISPEQCTKQSFQWEERTATCLKYTREESFLHHTNRVVKLKDLNDCCNSCFTKKRSANSIRATWREYTSHVMVIL